MRRSVTTGVAVALTGTLLGAGALLVALLSVFEGDDHGVWWTLAVLLFPTAGYAIAHSRLTSAWSRSTQKVQYYRLKQSRRFGLVASLCSFWVLLSQLIALTALVWLVVRLFNGGRGWLGAVIPCVIASGLAALGNAFSAVWDFSVLGQEIPTYAMSTNITDGYVEREVQQLSPSGSSDWNAFWLHRIQYETTHPPVDRPADDCVAYVIITREAAGLPPLIFADEDPPAPADPPEPGVLS